jgi:signal transduction histidine kinase
MLIQSLDSLAMKISDEHPKYGQELAKLHYEASRLNGDLVHLLALYRSDLKKLPLHIEEFFIEDLVEELVSRNQLYIGSRDIEVSIDIEPDLCWYLDPDLVGSLLNDVLANALRYTEKRIAITARNEDYCLIVEISDDGSGYPDEMLALNEPNNESFNILKGRTGLGLYFARLIAGAHKRGNLTGTIELKNNSCLGGSAFTLKLP